MTPQLPGQGTLCPHSVESSKCSPSPSAFTRTDVTCYRAAPAAAALGDSRRHLDDLAAAKGTLCPECHALLEVLLLLVSGGFRPGCWFCIRFKSGVTASQK